MKTCNACHIEKPFSEFYQRSGFSKDNPPTLSGHYQVECKDCMRERSRNHIRVAKIVSLVPSEIMAMNRLHSVGIPALPGKAVSAADVDVVAYGCVWIEIKYGKLAWNHGGECFKFSATPKQRERGFLADLVLLICEYPNNDATYHLFDAKHPVFYMKGRLKVGWQFTPGAMEAKKHGNNRVVMTQPLMDAAQDAYWLIEQRLMEIKEELKASHENHRLA